MPLEWWLTLATALFFCSLSPGSSALFALRTGLAGSFTYAVPAIVGLGLGFLGDFALIFTLLFFSIEINPHVLDWIGLCGGGYLVFLGGKDLWQAIFSKEIKLKNTTALHQTDSTTHDTWKKRIAMGALINVTNPKGYLFTIAFISQWLQSTMPWSFGQQALAICYVGFVIEIAVMTGYACFARFIGSFLHDPGAMRFIQGLLGAILCGVGLTMGLMRFL
jgi:threonine/homoserine/homoserine lactone efflux protein